MWVAWRGRLPFNLNLFCELITQQHNGVQKFGTDVARRLVKMANGKEVTPPQTKVGTMKCKSTIKDKMKNANFNLLNGSDPFFMSAEDLDKMMTNTPMYFTRP